MTIKEYLQSVLSSQDLSKEQESELQEHKQEITDYLRAEFGDSPVIKYAGSREKGTMICDHYDLDIVCYFPSVDERSLKEIRESVANWLAEQYLLKHKASAERILDLKGAEAPADFHIDVVPGRFIKDTKDVFLHVADGDKERMQTNLKVHIDHIVNSGCVPIIRLVKLWAYRNNVQIRTFVLELFVVEALSGYQSKGDLKKAFIKTLEAFKNDFTSKQLIDPANTNNIVSQLVSEADKKMISLAAEATLESISDSDNVEDWRTVFVDENIDDGNGKGDSSGSAATTTAASSYVIGESFTPQRQWSQCDDNKE